MRLSIMKLFNSIKISCQHFKQGLKQLFRQQKISWSYTHILSQPLSPLWTGCLILCLVFGSNFALGLDPNAEQARVRNTQGVLNQEMNAILEELRRLQEKAAQASSHLGREGRAARSALQNLQSLSRETQTFYQNHLRRAMERELGGADETISWWNKLNTEIAQLKKVYEQKRADYYQLAGEYNRLCPSTTDKPKPPLEGFPVF